MDNNSTVPILFPYEPSKFWARIRQIIHEEVAQTQKTKLHESDIMITPGLTQKPLYKITEICKLFNVSRTTVYEWIKQGKLRRVKIGSRVYFLGDEVKQLLQ
jgi:excisionase family DNA binding protein